MKKVIKLYKSEDVKNKLLVLDLQIEDILSREYYCELVSERLDFNQEEETQLRKYWNAPFGKLEKFEKQKNVLMGYIK